MATLEVCTSALLDSSNYIHRSLYMDDSLYPTVDRIKPNRPSTVYVMDNTCSAVDAEWQCYPYALDKCEALRTVDGWSNDYIQCLDDRFQACRKGAGCDYRYALNPEACKPLTNSGSPTRPLAGVIQDICQSPEKEYASQASYQACVDKVTQWWLDGCGNIEPQTMSGPVTNFWW